MNLKADAEFSAPAFFAALIAASDGSWRHISTIFILLSVIPHITSYIIIGFAHTILDGESRQGETMDKFIFGLVLGMAGGAVIVANNCKLQNLVKKNQEDMMQKAENYIDQKLEELDKKSPKTQKGQN